MSRPDQGCIPTRRTRGWRPIRLAPRVALVLSLFAVVAPPVPAITLAQDASATPATPTTPATPATTPAATPRTTSLVRLTAEPMLGGKVRPGDWAAVRVHVENDGPAIDGVLRVQGSQRQGATYSLPVQLATGARQEHVLDAQAGFFGGRFTVQLIEDGTVVASDPVAVAPIDPGQLGVLVIAERASELLPDLRRTAATGSWMAPQVAAIDPEDLPDHVEAWSAMDRLVWQDVPASRLTTNQLDALTTWVATGGDLVILGGSAGAGVLEGFPDDLLPYRPEALVDPSTDDLHQLITSLPPGATALPALAGSLREGTALASTGDQAVAARMRLGQGSVTILGFDPTVPWLSGTSAGDALWTSLLRPGLPGNTPDRSQDDGRLVSALGYLSPTSLPPMDQLLLLFLGYLLLLGPVTYLVLRRMDRREWAWVVMPLLAVVFTAAAWLLGVALRGTDVVINELAVVRGAADAERGLADAYIGVFSPHRASFDLALPGALISPPAREQFEEDSQPFDAQIGDPARLRDFQVGYGSLRAFRAKAAVDTPRVEADVRLVGDRLQGTVRNASDETLQSVALLYGASAQPLGDLAPGQEATVDVRARSVAGRGILRQLLEPMQTGSEDEARVTAGRLALLRQIAGETDWGTVDDRSLTADGPLLLAWRPGGVIDVQLDIPARRVGDTLFLLPVKPSVAGSVTFEGGAIGHTIVGSTAVGVYEDPGGIYLENGVATVDYRPGGLDGRFSPTSLAIVLGDAGASPSGDGEPIAPLPPSQQPSQDDPLRSGTGPRPPAGMPAVQLFDRTDGRWVELPPLTWQDRYTVADPERYVDDSGGLLVRFVMRGPPDRPFTLGVRLGGDVP